MSKQQEKYIIIVYRSTVIYLNAWKQKEKEQEAIINHGVPIKDANAKYCNLCKWTGISFTISWWIIGKKGGQFLSSIIIPAAKAEKLMKHKSCRDKCALASQRKLGASLNNNN